MNKRIKSEISVPETFSAEQTAKMLDLAIYQATQNAKEDEREEIVCRLLASGMSAEDVSLVLKIRKEAVKVIESNNASILIPKYEKTYKSRLKKREKQAK